MSWSKRFDDPIAIEGGELVTLRDAAAYVQGLAKSEQSKPHWQLAVETLISAADHHGITMLARIAMLRALNTGNPAPSPTKRTKRRLPAKIIR